MVRLRALASVLGLVLFVSAEADARPGLWTRARVPRSARVDLARARLERIFDGVAQAQGDAEMMQDFRLGTLAVAEMSGARALNDPALSLLLARALIGADIGREQEAVAILSQALRQLLPEQIYLEAELRVSLAEALHHDAHRAVLAVTQALSIVAEPAQRSALLRERAEAQLSLFRVREAVKDATRALTIAPRRAERLAARVVLGLALERQGDLPRAFEQFAWVEREIGAAAEEESPSFSFSFRPEDAAYCDGLRALQRASSAVDAQAREQALLRAVSEFREYEARAATEDRFVAEARAHRSYAESALKQLPAQ